MLYSLGARPHAIRDDFKCGWTKGSAWREAGSAYQACVTSLRIKQIQECKWQISRVCREYPGGTQTGLFGSLRLAPRCRQIAECSQATVAQYAPGRLGAGDEHAADRPGLCANWTIREVEIAFLQIAIPVQRQQLVDVRARRTVPQHALEHRTNEIPDLGERLGAAAPKSRGMLARAQDRPIGVVVELDEVGAPGDIHRIAGRKQDAEGRAQALRPMFDWADCRMGPLKRPHELAHLAAAGQNRVRPCKLTHHCRELAARTASGTPSATNRRTSHASIRYPLRSPPTSEPRSRPCRIQRRTDSR